MYEQLGMIWTDVAVIVFTCGLVYFAVKGAIEHQRLINKGREAEGTAREFERIIR